jgi:flagellar biosynthesis GTPase FlhF
MSAAAVVERGRVMNATDDTKTFRGRSLEEVLPQIKAEFGPDAEIVRQREGLMGGVGGFFQRPCIEVDARRVAEAEAEPEPERPTFDGYDEEGLAAPGIQEILRQASPFADHLSASLQAGPEDFEPMVIEPEPEPEPVAEPVAPQPDPAPPLPQTALTPVTAQARPQIAQAIEQSLVDSGIAAQRAAEIVAETVSHLMPFGSPRRLRRLVRQALAKRVPIAPTPAAGGRSLAFAGPGGSGKTLCTARLAAAYASGSDLPVVCVSLRAADGGAELRTLLEPLGVGVIVADSGGAARAHIAGAIGHALVVVDTPAVSPGSAAEVAALASELETLGLDELHLTLPATYSGPAALELAERLAPLRPTHVTLTHMDETSRVGGLVDALIDEGRPLSYVSQGTGVPGGLDPADPLDLAALVLP